VNILAGNDALLIGISITDENPTADELLNSGLPSDLTASGGRSVGIVRSRTQTMEFLDNNNNNNNNNISTCGKNIGPDLVT
jgi:hypothetical protein